MWWLDSNSPKALRRPGQPALVGAGISPQTRRQQCAPLTNLCPSVAPNAGQLDAFVDHHAMRISIRFSSSKVVGNKIEKLQRIDFISGRSLNDGDARMMVMSSSFTPWRTRASTAPLTGLSTTKLLKRPTTRANCLAGR